MSWLFSQALAEEYSADTSLAGEQFAQLNVMPTPHKFSRNDKMMEFSSLSRFGLTCAVLTESHGGELLTSFLAGFHARTSARPVGGAGIDGDKSGLWREMARIVSEVRPAFVFVENSPLLIGRGLARVIGDLTEIGFDCQWSRVSAKECGAPHKRDRLWLVGRNVRDTAGEGLPVWFTGQMERPTPLTEPQRPGWWPAEPGLGRVAHGMAHRVDRIKSLGNGQVPRVAATAFSLLREK